MGMFQGIMYDLLYHPKHVNLFFRFDRNLLKLVKVNFSTVSFAVIV